MPARKKTSKGLCRVTATYWETLPDGSRQRRTKYIERSTWTAADRAKAEFLESLGKAPERPDGKLSEAFALLRKHEWLSKSPDTLRNYDCYAAMVMEGYKVGEDHFPGLGHRMVSTITAPEITRYLAPLGGNVSARTINEHVKVLSAALAYSVSDLGWRDDNPTPLARKPKGKAVAPKPKLPRGSFEAIIPHVPEPWGLLFRLIAESGMRPIEAIARTSADLRWRHEMDWLEVSKSKTAAGERIVPISPESRAAMEAEVDPFASIRALKAWRKEMNNVWRVAVTIAGVEYTNPYKVRGMRLSEWARAKVDEDAVKMFAGHSDIRTTKAFYIEVEEEDAAKSLGVALGVRRSADGRKEPI